MTTPAKNKSIVSRRRHKKPGRRTVFTAATRKRLLELAAAGVPFRHACPVARVSYSAFCNYRNLHPEFEEQLQQAIGAAIEKHLKLIQTAAENGDTASSRWYLERCHPEFFSRSRLELTGENGSPLTVGIGIYLPQKNRDPQPVQITNAKTLPAPDETNQR